MVQRKLMAVQLVNYIHLTLDIWLRTDTGLELILAVCRGVHAHSFVLKCLLQWHIHVQHISTQNGRPRCMRLAFEWVYMYQQLILHYDK